MSELTDRIAEVLRECYQVFDENGHINGTVPGNGAWDCWCSEVVNTTFEAVTAHVAEQVVAELHLTADLVKAGESPPLYGISGWIRGQGNADA